MKCDATIVNGDYEDINDKHFSRVHPMNMTRVFKHYVIFRTKIKVFACRRMKEIGNCA